MKKHLMAFILFVALLAALPCVGAAPAPAGSMDNFTEVLPYEGKFTDVPANAWYVSVVGKAYSYGLIQGVSENRFNPNGSLSAAEAVAMADRVHSIYYTGARSFAESDPWYVTYVDYALENGILSEAPADCDEAVTRARFASILARAMPEEALPEVSAVEDNSIPDVASDSPYYDDFYLLYRAGILTGSDERGSARPDDPIIRAEAAAVLTRMADPDERRNITLTAPTVTMYAADGSIKTVNANEVAAYKILGWYTEEIVPLPSDLLSQRQTDRLPVISINTGGEISSKETYTSCTVSVYNVGQSQALSDVTGGIRLRGNSTAALDPPPYRIKFDSKQNLLGLNDGAETKSWVLLTGVDVSNIRHDIAFRFGRTLLEPDGYYCSDARYVHVYLNGSFLGPYLLAEQNQVNKNRVDVYEPEEGYTGTDIGYFVELDDYQDEPWFTMNYENATVTDINGTTRTFRPASYSVKNDVYDKSQLDFIIKYMCGVFRIVCEACENGSYLTFDQDYNVVPSTYQNVKETVEAVIDPRSFADMYILYEIMHDYDVGTGSFFMCVDFSAESKYPRLTLTAPWDFSWTCTGDITTYYAATYCPPDITNAYGDFSNPWFIVLYKQDWFRGLVKEKWAEIGGGGALTACIEEELAILDVNQADIDRSNSSIVRDGKVSLDWLTSRINWLDSEWTK